MKIINKTYRCLSAFVLILFLNSLILPVGLSAAGLFCNMEMGTGRSGVHTCFGVQSSDHSGDMLSDNEVCSYQQICQEAVTIRKDETEAIPQLSQGVAAVLGQTGSFVHMPVYSGMKFSPPESNTASSNLPIFLLNSVFLN